MSNLADIVSDIRKFLSGLTASISLDLLFYIAIGFQLLMILFFVIKSSFSYEMRMERVLYKLNKWLNMNQYIDQNNLIEFNHLMKKTPKLLRYHWHQYMLYREKDPSFYMSAYNVIEKPLKTSSFSSSIKNLSKINYCIAIMSFVIGLSFLSTSPVTPLDLTQCLIIPGIIFVLNAIFVMLLRARQDKNLSKFYLYFHYFNRRMDKAVTTMPEYVDFEVLFTKKEIRSGIPVLNEYLEKRARQEQEELEKARLNAVEHEAFDFKEAGINGSLVLDRAMKETATYLNFRDRAQGDIQQLESERDSLKRNYDNTQKDYQRKLQASKENVDRLRKQQEESTNRIESNYIKKQQQDEVKKQEQLEKDFDDATVRFNSEIQTIQSEIEKRKVEIEEHRVLVEDAMNAEYQTFSKKLYDEIYKSIEDRVNEEKQAIVDMKDGINEQLQQANLTIETQKKEISELRKVLEKKGVSVGAFDYYNEVLRKEAKKVKVGKHNKKELIEQVEIPEEPIIQEPVEEQILEEPVVEESVINETETYETPAIEETIEEANEALEEPVEELVEESAEELAEESVEEPQETSSEEPVYDEYGGYYDSEGYYRYANGTYYDPEGNYYDEFGGHYDPEGNYYPPVNAENVEESVEEAEMPIENSVEETEEIESAVEETEAFEEPAEEPLEEQEELVGFESDDDDIEFGSFESDDDDIVIGGIEEAEEADYEAEEPAEEETEDTDDIQVQPAKRRGRPRKIVEDVPAVEKRGRGRPRKEVVEEPKSKKGPGRPRKEQSETVAKKPVGRPKKEQTTPVAKKPVGRPRKETAPAAKKPVGRPKKVQTKSGATEKRGRGRPKKNDSLDEIKKLNKQILEENRKLRMQQAELDSKLGETLSQLDSNDDN